MKTASSSAGTLLREASRTSRLPSGRIKQAEAFRCLHRPSDFAIDDEMQVGIDIEFMAQRRGAPQQGGTDLGQRVVLPV